MNEEDEGRRQLLKSGPSSLKRQGPKRRPLPKPDPGLEKITNDIDFGEVKASGWDKHVVFKPNAGPQTDFLAAPEQEVLFGGAAGGGKSFALLADAARETDNPNHRALIVRRSLDELRELIDKSQELYKNINKNNRWNITDKTWVFTSGAKIWMSYLEHDNDVHRYQGQAFNYIAFDELTQWPSPYAWDYMRSRLRSHDKTLKLKQRACVDEGEVLTSNGWKDITTIQPGELVYSVSTNGTLELKKVTKFHKYQVEENLIRVKKKNLYMSMTPDHRVVYSKQGSKKRELIRFNEHTPSSIDILRSSDSYFSEGYMPNLLDFTPEAYASFIGLYVAEGSVNQKVIRGNYKVIITQNKIQNHDFVRSVMEESGCRVSYSKNGDFQITNKLLREHLLPLGKSNEKHFPREFLNKASKEQLKLAFDAYALGDGHWQSEKSVSLFTCSNRLADDLQEICVKLGYKCQKSYQKLDNPNHHNRWVIYVSLRSPLTRVDKGEVRNDVEYTPYKGYVYCFSVEDNENFVLRQKGCVWISGNTSNPGGIGHNWVKKAFIDPSPYGKAFYARDLDTGETLRYPMYYSNPDLRGKPLFRRRFIPSRLSDNPYLFEDGAYEKNLLSLPEVERKRLLEGDWDVFGGAAFPEWNRSIHVIEPFDIPRGWRKFRACDYGYGSFSAVVWFAVTPMDQLIVYRELYVTKVLAVDLADMILSLEADDGPIHYGVLDSSVWRKTGDPGPSLAEQMIARGCYWRPSDRSKGSRVAGKNEVHRRLQVDEWTGEPRILFFNNCTNLIAQLPVLPIDKDNPEDVDTDAEDHIYDALRYGCMSRPTNSNFDEFRTIPTFRPVDPVFGW